MCVRFKSRTWLVIVALAIVTGAWGAEHDPFFVLAPDVAPSIAERETLAAGLPVARIVPARDTELSLWAAVRTDASPERLLAWSTAPELTLKGRYMPQVGRFSQPPRIQDLDGLTMEDDDLEDLVKCRPGDCGLKLGDHEMTRFDGLHGAPEWKERVQATFKQVLVDRAAHYLEGGDAAATVYHDKDRPVVPRDVFTSLVDGIAFLHRDRACLARYLRHFPEPGDAHIVESYLYWSKEVLGARPIVSITHQTVARFKHPTATEVVVISKQVFATHYKNGAIAVITLSDRPRADRYLVYLYRANLDVFHGFWGGMVRKMVERRIRHEVPRVLVDFRNRLDRGDLSGVSPGTR